MSDQPTSNVSLGDRAFLSRSLGDGLLIAVGVPGQTRQVHLGVEDCSEELLRQQSYVIKNQLVASKAPY